MKKKSIGDPQGINELQLRLNAELNVNNLTNYQQLKQFEAKAPNLQKTAYVGLKSKPQINLAASHQSENISNNNSPLHDPLRTNKKSSKSNMIESAPNRSKRDLIQSIQQQKLQSILGFMAGRHEQKVFKSSSKNSRLINSYAHETSSNNVTQKGKRKNSAVEIDTDDQTPHKQLLDPRLRKNQSVSEIPPHFVDITPSISPVLAHSQSLKYNSLHQAFTQTRQKKMNLQSQSFQRPLPTHNKPLKSSSFDRLEKHKSKLRSLLNEREHFLSQDLHQGKGITQQESNFFVQFNQTLHQLCLHLLLDGRSQNSSRYINKQLLSNNAQTSLPMSTQDSMSNFHLDHIFKNQIQIIQQFFAGYGERSNSEQIIAQLKRKNDQYQMENKNLTNELKECLLQMEKISVDRDTIAYEKQKLQLELEQLTKNMNQNIPEEQKATAKSFEAEQQELKYLIQGQFEAIQKLLQREQLVKVFLKRVGDSHIIQQPLQLSQRMFEQFIQNAEQIDYDDTEGNINVNAISPKETGIERKKEVPTAVQVAGQLVLEKYETSYKQLNLCDSLMADDSRIYDSEESSFRFYGKEQGSELFYQAKHSMMNAKQFGNDLKEKLKINMMDVQLIPPIAQNCLINS